MLLLLTTLRYLIFPTKTVDIPVALTKIQSRVKILKSSFKYGLKHEFDLVQKNDDSNGYKEETNRAPAPTESNDVRIKYMSKLQFGLSKWIGSWGAFKNRKSQNGFGWFEATFWSILLFALLGKNLMIY